MVAFCPSPYRPLLLSANPTFAAGAPQTALRLSSSNPRFAVCCYHEHHVRGSARPSPLSPLFPGASHAVLPARRPVPHAGEAGRGRLVDLFLRSEGPGPYPGRRAVDAAGRPVVGGYYDSVNGVGRRGIARLNRDGSLDETFAPDLFIVSTVDPIALQRDGKLLLNAHVPANLNEIFRLNTKGASDGFYVPFITAVAYEIIAMPDGRTVMGGYFGGLGGGGIGIYRFETNGSLDSTFTPAAAKFGAAGTGAVGQGVNALAYQSDGKLVVGGAFQSLGGSARTGIARLETDGHLDPGFTPSIDTNAVLTGVFVQPDGSILITGSFTNVNNAERYRIARLNPDGKLVDALQFEPPAPLINGQMRLALKVPSPQKWLIQASADLRTWTSIHTNIEAKTQFEFVDESAQGLQQRFYRALTVP